MNPTKVIKELVALVPEVTEPYIRTEKNGYSLICYLRGFMCCVPFNSTGLTGVQSYYNSMQAPLSDEALARVLATALPK